MYWQLPSQFPSVEVDGCAKTPIMGHKFKSSTLPPWIAKVDEMATINTKNIVFQAIFGNICVKN
jgi:hypothetical protein